MTGKAASFYYKRMRDSLNRVTIFVVPEVATMFSFSVGGEPTESGVTFFTVDKKTVNSMAVEFERYMSRCEPIMRSYSTEDGTKRLWDCMLDYESCQSDCIQRSNSLSLITLPWDVATRISSENPQMKDEFLSSFARRNKAFAQNLKTCSVTDIIRLATPDSVMAGRVPISAACIFGGERQYYTPSAYLKHLRHILFLLEHQKNYHVLFRDPEDSDPTIVYVKEGFRTILAREEYPFSLFEVSEHYLLGAFTEYLRRMLPEKSGEAAGRRAAVSRLRADIAALEKKFAGRGQALLP